MIEGAIQFPAGVTTLPGPLTIGKTSREVRLEKALEYYAHFDAYTEGDIGEVAREALERV